MTRDTTPTGKHEERRKVLTLHSSHDIDPRHCNKKILKAKFTKKRKFLTNDNIDLLTTLSLSGLGKVMDVIEHFSF